MVSKLITLCMHGQSLSHKPDLLSEVGLACETIALSSIDPDDCLFITLSYCKYA